MTSRPVDSLSSRASPPRRRLWAALGLLLAVRLCSLGWSRAEAQPAPPPYRVITHPANVDTTVERKFLAQAFLKRTSTWSDGETIHPVDLPGASPTRRHFSEDVLERPVAAVRSYWQQLIFSGRGLPPPELDSDEAVLRYVSKHPGAVGYVSGTIDVRNAKVLNVR
jgi:ABC-type phosphate transport system substrate-binding protein